MDPQLYTLGLKKSGVPISLYVHIPFCTKKCAYCDFFSLDSVGYGEKKAIIERILEDIDAFLAQLKPPSIETVYIGGGTPNSLEKDLFVLLLEGVGRRVGGPKEWTVEVNPEFLDLEKLGIMKTVGVNRLSMGVQSFHQEKLELIGRSCSVEDSERALRLLEEYWHNDWSLDIMTLLPSPTEKHSVEEWRTSSHEDIRRAISYKPKHLSLYGLTAEPGTPFFAQLKGGDVFVPGEESTADLLLDQWRLLKREGYVHYEVSNFARGEDHKSLHNLRYWRLDPYIGIGPSAVSTLPGSNGPIRIQFKPDIGLYSRGRGKERFEKEEISPFSFLLEHLMTGLRIDEGVVFSRIAKRFGTAVAVNIRRNLEGKLKRYEESGFITRESSRKMHKLLRGRAPRNHGFHATDNGLMILDSLLLDLSGGLDRVHPETVKWP